MHNIYNSLRTKNEHFKVYDWKTKFMQTLRMKKNILVNYT